MADLVETSLFRTYRPKTMETLSFCAIMTIYVKFRPARLIRCPRGVIQTGERKSPLPASHQSDLRNLHHEEGANGGIPTVIHVWRVLSSWVLGGGQVTSYRISVSGANTSVRQRVLLNNLFDRNPYTMERYSIQSFNKIRNIHALILFTYEHK